MVFSARVIYADTVNYCNAVGYSAVSQWASSHDYKAGDIVRQLSTPILNNERCFVALNDATSGTTEPAWVLTRGAKTTGSPAWMECTGGPAVNGDLTNTPTWSFAVNYLTGRKIAIGQIVKRSNNASYQICSTAGIAGGAEPAFSDTAGVAAIDGTVVWTSLGPPGKFVKGGAPHDRITNAGVEHWFYGGGTIFVGDTHAESQAGELAFRTAFESTDPLLMSMMLCHDHAGNYPPTGDDLRAEATVSTGYRFDWYSGGSFYVYGITFKAGAEMFIRPLGSVDTFFAAEINRQNWVMFDRCSLWFSGRMYFGESYIFGARVEVAVIFNNTTIKFKNSGDYITPFYATFIWRNTKPVLVPGSAVPSSLMSTYGIDDCFYDARFEACDFSQLKSKLFSSDFWQQASSLFKDCKLHPAATFDLLPEDVGMHVQTVRCDPGVATWRSDRYRTEGRDSTDTVITRAGGAIDLDKQPQTRRLTTLDTTSWLRPLPVSPFTVWIPTAGSQVTLTVYGLADKSVPVMNDDIWLEVSYLADPASTLSTMVSTTKPSVISLNTTVPSDGSKWNGSSSVMFDYTQALLSYLRYGTIWLSNGNRTATLDYSAFNDISGGARSFAFQASGKYYFEVKAITDNNSRAGIMSSLDSFGDFFRPLGGHSFEVALANGHIIVNGNDTFKSLGVFSPGDVVGIAVDLYNQGWARKNAGPWNANPAANPAGGTGGFALLAAGVSAAPAIFLAGSTGNAVTLNCGWSAYAAPPPLGFGSWPAGNSRLAPFKLTVTVTPAHAGYINAQVMVGKPNATFFIDPQIVVS